MRLNQLTEATYHGDFIGTLSNTVSLGNISWREAEKLELLLRKPEIGWHTTAWKDGSEWFLRLTINVNKDKLE
jgi:hypothetical protein